MNSNFECVFEVTYKTSVSEQVQTERFRFDELSELKKLIKRQKQTVLHVLSNTDKHIYAGANTAFKFGIELVVNEKRYVFCDDKSHLNDRQITIELIKQSSEFVFFRAMQNKLINIMLIESPLFYSEQQAVKSVQSIFQVDRSISVEMGNKINMKGHTLNRLKAEFDKRRRQAKGFISIGFNTSFIYSSIDFKKQIIDYVADNDGIFILNDSLGSGKTKYGLRPLFEHFCSDGLKPIFITPFIALTNKIVSDDRNYRSKKAQFDPDSLVGLATCVDSISTKRHYDDYRESSQATIVDEFEECLSSFSQQARMGKTLSNRSNALAEFVKLLNKPKVILADALFCDISIRQLQKLTNKKIHILNNSAAPKYQAKTINVIDDQQHLFNLIESRKSGESMAIFNDASQQKFNKYKSIFEAVTDGNEQLGFCVNAKFLRSKTGQQYLEQIEYELKEKQVHQFSPSITSGHSIEEVKMDSVNIFSNKTILPTQIVQCTGRFRLNSEIGLSFFKPNTPVDFELDIKTIKQELINEELYKNSSAEASWLEASPYVDVIAERVQQQRAMRKNHCAFTLLMLEHIGCKIDYKHSQKGSKEIAKKTLSKATSDLTEQNLLDYLAEPISAYKYKEILSKSHWNTEAEEQQKEIYEFVNFYQLYDHPMLIEEVLICDDFGRRQNHLFNIELLNTNVVFIERELAYKKQVLEKLAEVTGILEKNMRSWDTNDAMEFISWLSNEEIVTNGTLEPVARYFKAVFTYTKISESQPASTIRSLLDKEFGLTVLKSKQSKAIKGKRDYDFKIKESDLDRLRAAMNITLKDTVKRMQGLLYFYKQSFPELEIDDGEIKIDNHKKLERLLVFAQSRASNYDYLDQKALRMQSEAYELGCMDADT